MEKVIKATLIIITHRSDKRFERSLSCGQWFAETVVINTGANADWKILSKKYDFKKIEKLGYITDFSKARNEALTLAQNDWVFFLDSDEYIETASVAILSKIVESNNWTGAWVTRVDMFLGKQLHYGEAGKHGLLRLMKKKVAHFINPVHEIAQVAGNVTMSNAIIFHQPHQSIADFINKVSLYASLLGKEKESKLTIMLKMLFFPPLKFLSNYVLRLGFLDGYPGFVYALIMSLHSLWVRVFQYENQYTSNRT